MNDNVTSIDVARRKKNQLHVVHWYNMNNSLTGHGQPMPLAAAKDAVEYANHNYTDIHHWVEPTPKHK